MDEFELFMKYYKGEPLTDAEALFLAGYEIDEFLREMDRDHLNEGKVLNYE